MGDPRKIRKKYDKPGHPWEKERIDEEKILKGEYGFRNKKEIWKMKSELKKHLDQAKKLIATRTEQAEKEKQQMFGKLQRLGLLGDTPTTDDVLSLALRDLLERRLQTVVYKKGLARSTKQARQFIIHQHIMIGDKKISSPSYLVTTEEEALIAFHERSALIDPEHPERQIKSESTVKKEMAKEESEEGSEIAAEAKEQSEKAAEEKAEEVKEAVEEATKEVAEEKAAAETPAEETKEVAEETKEEVKAEATKEEVKAEETKEEVKAEETKEEVKAEETKEETEEAKE